MQPSQFEAFENQIHNWFDNECENDPENSENLAEAVRRITLCYHNMSITLDLRGLRLRTLPNELFQLRFLTNLNLSNNRLEIISPEIANLQSLRELDLRYNQLTTLPDEFVQISSLDSLTLCENSFREFPSAILNNRFLSYLDLSSNQLTTLPREINRLSNLFNLDLGSNQLTTLPDEFEELHSLACLTLSDNSFREFPSAILNLTNLEGLFLGCNRISILPDGFINLSRLRNLSIADNIITELPAEFNRLTALETLDLERNQLTVFPRQIRNLRNLVSLNLDQNLINHFNEELTHQQILGIFPSLRLINRVEIQANQAPTIEQNLFDILSRYANFSEQEKSQFYQIILHPDEMTADDEGQVSSLSQTLTVRLGAIYEFFHNSISGLQRNGSYSENQDIKSQAKSNLILAINRFNQQPNTWESKTSEQKKLLACHLLSILSQVYERKEDETFLKEINSIAKDSLDNCIDRNSLLIFSLANFCQRKNIEILNPLIESKPLQLLDYFKNQLLYNYFLTLGQERIDEIKLGTSVNSPNPFFSEDVEVLLNYLRIYNNEFGRILNLQLPNITQQQYFDIDIFKPSVEQIREFREICDSYEEGNFLPLQTKLSEIFVDNLHTRLPIYNPEILAINFISKHLKQIEDIAHKFTGLIDDNEDYLTLTCRDDAMTLINETKKQIEKDELKIIFQDSLIKLASNQKPIEEFSIEKLNEIKQKFISSMQENLGINITEEDGEIYLTILPSGIFSIPAELRQQFGLIEQPQRLR